MDDLSGIFVKQGASLLATPPITQLCNLSISSGTFLKNGSKTDRKNYRQVSLLPLKSKVLEGRVHEKTLEFFDKHNILLKFQSEFPKTFSIDFFLSCLPDKISKGFDSGLLTGVILIDL